jgi:hypothetical protein
MTFVIEYFPSRLSTKKNREKTLLWETEKNIVVDVEVRNTIKRFIENKVSNFSAVA